MHARLRQLSVPDVKLSVSFELTKYPVPKDTTPAEAISTFDVASSMMADVRQKNFALIALSTTDR